MGMLLRLVSLLRLFFDVGIVLLMIGLKQRSKIVLRSLVVSSPACCNKAMHLDTSWLQSSHVLLSIL
jgi:hypothetical protein